MTFSVEQRLRYLAALEHSEENFGSIPPALLTEAADRIEELETLLKEVTVGYDWCLANDQHLTMASVLSEAIADARTTLQAKG